MKRILLSIFTLLFIITLFGQVTNEGKPLSWTLTQEKSSFKSIELPQIDLERLKKEDEINDNLESKPYRFGFKHQVNYGLENSGGWLELENGDRIWRILFESKSALSLNFIFDKFYLPEGANVYLYNYDRTDLLGAYTSIQNQKSETLGTWIVEGDRIWIEYYEPSQAKGLGKLNIGVVTHGYRSKYIEQKELGESGSCNHDVDCNIGADFEGHKNDLKKSVALILNNGNDWCTGTLINNTNQDKKPYLLTANHCLSGNTNDWSFRFGWISPTPVCGEFGISTNGPTNMSISGATLRANNSNSDVALLELNSAIPDGWERVWAGWDRSDDIPNYTIGIHHPSGDIMKICRDNDEPIKLAQHAGGASPIAQTWDITGLASPAPTGSGLGWEIGVTEGGSSGSALFDPNGRIIGQLYGGAAACSGFNDNDGHDYYGRFAISWDSGGSSSNQLKNWLDPANSNPTTLDRLDSTLSTNDEILEQNLTLYPNPTSGLVQVRITDIPNELKYEVYNLLGQKLQSNLLERDQSIDLSNLPNSIYLVKIIDLERNASLTKKIVLSK